MNTCILPTCEGGEARRRRSVIGLGRPNEERTKEADRLAKLRSFQPSPRSWVDRTSVVTFPWKKTYIQVPIPLCLFINASTYLYFRFRIKIDQSTDLDRPIHPSISLKQPLPEPLLLLWGQRRRPAAEHGDVHAEVTLVVADAEGYVAQGIGAGEVFLYLFSGMVGVCRVSRFGESIHHHRAAVSLTNIYVRTLGADGVAAGEEGRERHVVRVKYLGVVVEGAHGLGEAAPVANLAAAAGPQVRHQVVMVHNAVFGCVVREAVSIKLHVEPIGRPMDQRTGRSGRRHPP